VLRETLELAGHTVIEARNGADGLDLFRKRGADLVITDIVMPDKDGLDVVRGLREQVPPVNIIAMSGAGNSAEDYLDLAYRMGAVKVLLKPFTPAADRGVRLLPGPEPNGGLYVGRSARHSGQAHLTRSPDPPVPAATAGSSGQLGGLEVDD
jgi:CheY-like chemotaxis protein